MTSFDVLLFIAIPVDRACERIRNKLNKDNTLGQRSRLSIDDIIKLLHFTLSTSYFTYNNETCKQIHGCAMGSPVSPTVKLTRHLKNGFALWMMFFQSPKNMRSPIFTTY